MPKPSPLGSRETKLETQMERCCAICHAAQSHPVHTYKNWQGEVKRHEFTPAAPETPPDSEAKEEAERESHIERLLAMIAPDQQTWDLSDNDVAAIKWAVLEVSKLAETPRKEEA